MKEIDQESKPLIIPSIVGGFFLTLSILSYVYKFEINNLEVYTILLVFNILTKGVLRVVGLIWCLKIAESLNRKRWWSLFGFIAPSVTLTIMGLLKKLKDVETKVA